MFIARFLLVFIALVALALSPAKVCAAPSRAELKARQAFGASHYQEALDLYAQLYAEKLHPVYLRNIGRCYQNLGEPDKAISSFHEYLRKAKEISPGEKAEIDGYIAEMEALKKQREVAAAPVAGPVFKPSPPPEVKPPPAETMPLAVMATPNESAPQETSLFAKPWFWGVVGAVVVVAVVGGLAAGGAFSSAKDATCDMGRTCGQ